MASKTELMLAAYELYSHLRKATLNYQTLVELNEKNPSNQLKHQILQLSEEINLIKRNIETVSRL